MQADSSLTAIAHVIQLAVAPVFLITGIGAILNVTTTRLARIIDRVRVLDAIGSPSAEVQEELALLTRRARFINWSIAMITASALFIATLIVALFLGAFLSFNVTSLVGGFFVVAMVALIGGLVAFLFEIRLAMGTLRIRH